MSREKEALARDIAQLETMLGQRKAAKAASKTRVSKSQVVAAINEVEKMVTAMYGDESACGGGLAMDETEMAYMDEDDDDFEDDDLLVDLDDDFDDDDFEEDIVFASEDEPGIEDEITQDYLDDVLEEEKNPASIDTDETMLETAPTGYEASSAKTAYVARLKRASARLDKVSTYVEQQGDVEMALRLDKMADAIDARIAKEVNNG